LIYLGLGSNEGDRHDNIRRALQRLQQQGVHIDRLAPLLETPAVLPAQAPEPWNYPYLNIVAECRTRLTPAQLQSIIGAIDRELGRADNLPAAAPHPIAIDILLWHDQIIARDGLNIPYPLLHKRAWYLSSLLHLQPDLTIPGQGAKTLFEWSCELAHHHPLWMGILNITPDSFSDGGRFSDWTTLEPQLDAMLDAGAHILDIGAESTRPGATPLDAAQEWQRLQPLLAHLQDKLQGRPLRPLVSIDTYHAEVAERALAWGADVINDVSGLTSPAMQALAKTSGKDWVAMHSVTVPAAASATLPEHGDPHAELDHWLQQQLEVWDKAGIERQRIIFDPGIGFGKNSLQSLRLLRGAGHFRRHGLRVLVGHSRKSYMRRFGHLQQPDKDLVTVGAALALCAQNIDIIRVHNIPAHTAAYRGWVHLQPQTE
jgi:2-amino-4-hydroxy-6-hydroxymethyldihydropteridine diphosphokinase/dihydropteroate synthase